MQDTDRIENLRQEVEDRLSQLRQLRDEVKVYLHLGSMEIKEQWRHLEPRIQEAEQFSKVLTEASRGVVTDIYTRAKALRDSLAELKAQRTLGKH
jgi:hypothetical protein